MPLLKRPVKSASQTGEPSKQGKRARRGAKAAAGPCTVITVRARPGTPQRGWLSCGPLRVPCALGKNGISRFTREGSGTTPAGRWRLVAVRYRADRGPRLKTPLPVHTIRPADGWCDAPDDRNYNRFVCHPYTASAEHLWREDCLYDIIVVLDHNQRPRRRHFGSAIFFHVAKPGFPPTAGCIAVSAGALRRVLAMAGPCAVLDIR